MTMKSKEYKRCPNVAVLNHIYVLDNEWRMFFYEAIVDVWNALKNKILVNQGKMVMFKHHSVLEPRKS